MNCISIKWIYELFYKRSPEALSAVSSPVTHRGVGGCGGRGRTHNTAPGPFPPWKISEEYDDDCGGRDKLFPLALKTLECGLNGKQTATKRPPAPIVINPRGVLFKRISFFFSFFLFFYLGFFVLFLSFVRSFVRSVFLTFLLSFLRSFPLSFFLSFFRSSFLFLGAYFEWIWRPIKNM